MASSPPSGGRGLVSMSYGGDSEISDSEDERTSTGNTPPAVAMGGLGIPASNPRFPSSPPSLDIPEVHAAPSIVLSGRGGGGGGRGGGRRGGGGGGGGLVAYGMEEEDEDHNESRERDDDVFPLSGEKLGSLASDSTQSANEEVPLIEITEDSVGEGDLSPFHRVQLPPEPPGTCPKALQDKIITLLAKKEQLGRDLNRSLQQRKDFRNPSIYEKLVQFCNIDEFGTNYPAHLYNPSELGEESRYNNLGKAQKSAYEKKEKAKLERTKVEFVTGTKRPVGVASATAGGADAQKKPRKSKWDVSADSGGSRGSSPSRGSGTAGGVGAKAIAQAKQLNDELKLLEKK